MLRNCSWCPDLLSCCYASPGIDPKRCIPPFVTSLPAKTNPGSSVQSIEVSPAAALSLQDFTDKLISSKQQLAHGRIGLRALPIVSSPARMCEGFAWRERCAKHGDSDFETHYRQAFTVCPGIDPSAEPYAESDGNSGLRTQVQNGVRHLS